MTQPERRERADSHVEAYLTSGLTIPAYCKSQQISLGTFQGWIDRYRKEKQASSEFLTVDITSLPDQEQLSVSIVSAKGTQITLSGVIDLNELTGLVRVLEEC